MLRRITGLCTLSLALTIAGCPSNPETPDAPIGSDAGDAGPRPDARDGGGADVPGDAGPMCGNGTVESGETCDDDNTTAGDGCDAVCAEETGWDCDGASPTVCTEVCGDGNVVGDEAGTNGCDDNNTADGDGCAATCMVEMGWACSGEPSTCTPDCGDGAVNGAEECDDGDNADLDGCSMSCQVEDGWACDTAEPSVCTSTCGDGTVAAGAETCDDTNTTAGDGCSDTCQTETGWDCSGGTCAPICGDMMVLGGEECDDGNTVSESCMYGLPSCTICAADCTNQAGVTSFCGDSMTDMMNSEMCDDGNTVTETACAYGTATCMACSANCMMALSLTGPVCGDGTVNAANGETCDDSNTTPGDGCDATCQVESVCGDGVIEGLETCDDNNTAAGDGCSASCATETGFVCYGTGPSFCGRVCPSAEMTVIGCGSGTVMGDTTGATSAITAYATCTTSTSYAGGERIYVFRNDTGSPQDVRIVSAAGTATGDYDLFVLGRDSLETCGTARSCIDGSRLSGAAETVDFTAPDGRPFYVVFDPFGTSTTAGTFSLTVTCGATACGNGTRSSTEQCDDNNTVSGDGCSSGCVTELGYTCTTASPSVCTRTCGNGTLQSAAGETCDDGNTASGDGCSSSCGIESGFVCSGTPSTCRRVTCGDGFRDAPETCDDGNTTASDGCSATCTVESGYSCTTATPNVCTRLPYLVSTISLACADMSTGTTLTLTDNDDGTSTTAALPFSVAHFGTTMTHYQVSSNGFAAVFPSAAGVLTDSFFGNATTVPSASNPNGYLAPYWDDLSNITVRTRTLGAPGSQVFVLEWDGQTFSGSLPVRAQLHVLESGVFEFHYCAGTVTGSSATIAVENAAGTAGVAHAINTAGSVTSGTTALRFTPNP